MKRSRRIVSRVSTGVLLLLGLPLGTAVADSDGGTRSVFATGAGNRALAMGGAYAAIADDASAALWNPAGLGFVSRREIQLSRSGLYGLDMSEEFAALVWPSWRLGAAALSVRHFGVEGIEGRDDRNVVTDEDLSSSETEITLSFGRKIGTGWSLGGSVKMQRQDLAGLSSGGVGVDAGLLVQPYRAIDDLGDWAEGLALGVSVRNLIEPEIRLDQESVADPMTLRLGSSYKYHLGGGRYVLASIDVEDAETIDSRLHAGLEVRLQPMVTLRTGFDSGMATAGAGFLWGGLAVDYAYETGDIGEQHRIGLAIGFGPTTEESRLASIRATERTVQQRLATAFEQRQPEQTTIILEDARRAQEDGRLDEALELLAALNAIRPGHEEAGRLEGLWWREKAMQLEEAGDYTEASLTYGRALEVTPDDSVAAWGAARCREKSDRNSARSEDVRSRFAKALDSFSAGDLGKARVGFLSILEIEPEDAETAAMLERTNRAIGHRVRDLIDQAERYARGGMTEEAARALEEARGLDPKAKGIAKVEALLRPRSPLQPASAVAESPVAEPASGKARPLTERQQKETEDFYERGIAAMQEGRVDAAIRYWELVYAVDPDHKQVRELLKREYLMQGMDSFAAGRLDEAVSLWEKALQIEPGDEKTIAYLARAQQQLSRTREILGQERR